MPIQLNEENGGKLLAAYVSGKLVKADYEHFVPEFERLVGLHGKMRVLFDMTGFDGWTTAALWEDTKFTMHHFSDIDRLAVVGEKKWKEWQRSASRSRKRPSNTSIMPRPPRRGSGWAKRRHFACIESGLVVRDLG